MSLSAPLRRVVLLLALVGLAAPAAGVRPASAKRAPEPAPGNRQMAAPAALREMESVGPVSLEGGIQRRYGVDSGVLRRFWRLQPGSVSARAATPRAAATAFLRDNAAALGLAADAPEANLALVSEQRTPSGTHFRWNQTVNGVPVFRAEIVVKVSNLGEVSSVQNNLLALDAVPTKAIVDAPRAVALGVAAVAPSGRALGKYEAELAIVALERGARLVYRVSVPNERPMGDWLVLVDARTGDVLGVEDRMTYATGTGRVFDPDPESKTGNPSLPDNADGDAGIPFPGAYEIRTLQDITNTAGTFSLSGPFARIIEFESPIIAPVTATHPDSFRFQRSASGFEDAMVYYQIDNIQRYFQSLGFTNFNNRVQELDTHGLSGADNSHYVPSSLRIAFGEGGVDDAEDADVVVHEYGHSCQHNAVPSWGGGQEGAMGEGYGDYIAGSYSLSLYPTHEANFVFNWDGHNEFWPGRLLRDFTMHYPEDCCGEVHDSGTLWCSGLIDAWYQVGRTVMDKIVIDHHFALGGTATMADAAAQVIQSDIDLYGGAHVGQLVTVFDFWGFVNAEDYLPVITHTPLSDTENTTGPYVVTATITAAQPLVPSSLKLHYGTTGSFTNELALTPTGNPNEYSASIPGPLSGVDVRYYLIASDANGGTSTHPPGAPGSYHEFHVGPDPEAPVIVHTPIGNTARIAWPASVQATVTDNLGVNPDSVRVDWSQNGTPRQTFYIPRVGVTNVWNGPFPSDTTQVAIGDVIAYKITARDLATVPNTATNPPSGNHGFVIIASRGTVLVLDDDDVAKASAVKVLSEQDAGKEGRVIEENARVPDVGHSANDIASILNSLGFTATVENAATSNSATWNSYALLISSSGGNEGPVANAAYRSAIEAYVASGRKLLVEGGEVEYDATSSPGYPTFASNVLHTTDWDADNAGTLNLLSGQSAHPIARLPNVLPSSLPIAYTGFGSEDSYKPVAPAYIVYGVTAQPGNGGILVYDPTPSPQSAQIVVFGFDFKDVGDVSSRTKLLENAVEYLLRPEGTGTATIRGRVILAGQTDHSGTTVSCSPGGPSVVTGPDGNYTLSGLYALPYDVQASHAGYETSSQSGVPVTQGGTTNVFMVLYPQATVVNCLNPGTAIPDNNPAGIQSNMTVAQAFTVKSVEVSVNIPHTYMGDLIVELRHGAKTVRVHNRSGGSTPNLVGSWPPRPVDGPGALANFTGDPSNGTWTLFVSDNAGQDVGTLQQWCLTLRGPGDSTVVLGVPGENTPKVAWLAPSQPNPVTQSGTSIRYALPRAAQASLVVYDVSGRRIRTLVEARMPAGEHQVSWDGRDGSGKVVPAGAYLYRLRTESFDATRRLVVLR